MALTYDDITATTIKHFRPALVDNIFNDIPLFKRMRAQDAVSVRGGDSIMQSLLYATTTSGGSYSGYDVLLTTPNEQISAAEFSWKQYYVNITIDKLSVLKNSGPEQIFNLLQKRVQAAQLTMADTLATDLFSDGTTNSSKCITGLRAAVDDSSNIDTYGGILRSTNTWWKAIYKGNSGTDRALTIPIMEDAYNDVEDGMDAPTCIVMGADLYEKYWRLAEADKSLMNVMSGDMGLTTLSFNGIPIIKDRKCTAENIFMLNEKYLELVIHSDEQFEVRPFQEPVDQNVATSKVFVTLNLVSSNCRRQCRIVDLDYSL